MNGHDAVLSLGGNRGDVESTLSRAIKGVEASCGRVRGVSRRFWTEPEGFMDDQLFLNRAVLVRTTLPPEELLKAISYIEEQAGRVRVQGQGPTARPLDIDILLYADRVVRTEGLSIPHPRMHIRHFALAPAADVAPGMVHATTGRTVLQLLNALGPA